VGQSVLIAASIIAFNVTELVVICGKLTSFHCTSCYHT
jgi:hypothetical protein